MVTTSVQQQRYNSSTAAAVQQQQQRLQTLAFVTSHGGASENQKQARSHGCNSSSGTTAVQQQQRLQILSFGTATAVLLCSYMHVLQCSTGDINTCTHSIMITVHFHVRTIINNLKIKHMSSNLILTKQYTRYSSTGRLLQ